MTDLFKLILGILASRFKARATLEAENLVLRQQVNVLRRRTPKRPHLNNTDRFLFVWLYRWFPSVLEVVAIVRPETIISRHSPQLRGDRPQARDDALRQPCLKLRLESLSFLLVPAVDQPIVCIPTPRKVWVRPCHPEIKTAAALAFWLKPQSHHPTMPNFILSPQQVRNVSAYLLSLRD